MNLKETNYSCLFLGLLFALIACSPAMLAADSEASGQAVVKDTTADFNTTNSNIATTLKGGTRFDALQTEEHLKRIKRLTADLQKTTMVLMTELQNQQLLVALGPNYFSNVGVIVTPAVPRPDGMLRMGEPKPVSTNVLATLLLNIRNSIVQLRAVAKAINLPPDLQQRTEWEQVAAQLEDMVEHNNKLASVAQAAQPSRKAIGREALKIYDDTNNVKKPLRYALSEVGDLAKGQTSLASKQGQTY